MTYELFAMTPKRSITLWRGNITSVAGKIKPTLMDNDTQKLPKFILPLISYM